MREQSKSAAEPELPSPSLSPESPRSGAPRARVTSSDLGIGSCEFRSNLVDLGG